MWCHRAGSPTTARGQAAPNPVITGPWLVSGVEQLSPGATWLVSGAEALACETHSAVPGVGLLSQGTATQSPQPQTLQPRKGVGYIKTALFLRTDLWQPLTAGKTAAGLPLASQQLARSFLAPSKQRVPRQQAPAPHRLLRRQTPCHQTGVSGSLQAKVARPGTTPSLLQPQTLLPSLCHHRGGHQRTCHPRTCRQRFCQSQLRHPVGRTRYHTHQDATALLSLH